MNRDLLLRLLNDNWQRLANCMQEQSVDVVVSAYPPDVRHLAGPGPFVTRVMAEAVGTDVSRETPAHLKEVFDQLWPRAKVRIGSTRQQARAVESSLEEERR